MALNIRNKILVGYISILLLFIIVVGVLLFNLNSLTDDFEFLIEHDLIVLSKSDDLLKLVVDQETGMRGFVVTGQENFLEPYDNGRSEFESVYNELFELVSNYPEQQNALVDIKEAHDEWLVYAEGVIEARRTGSGTSDELDAATAIITSGQGKAYMDAMRVQLHAWSEEEIRLSDVRAENAREKMQTMELLTIGLSVIGVVFGLSVGFYLGNDISRNIRAVMTAAENVRQGDLNQRVELSVNDEVGVLADAFNAMVDSLSQTTTENRNVRDDLEIIIGEYNEFVAAVASGNLSAQLELNGRTSRYEVLFDMGQNLNSMVSSLRDMSIQVREAANAVSAAATEIQAVTTQQAASMSEQNTAITQTSATLEEVRRTVSETSDRAQNVADNAQKSLEVSQQGQEAVIDTVGGMEAIRKRVESIAETILMLSERTQQIGDIINSVNGIADQSKLLALNASIEAARAGEEGRGFAVVAMEVRQLAEQSRDATSRVGEILGEIQHATNTAVMVTEEGSKGTEMGVQLVDRAGQAIRDLADTLEQATSAAQQIAASTYQQTNGVNQLAQAMEQIRQSSMQTTAGMKQAEQSTRDLIEMARVLESAAARYIV